MAYDDGEGRANTKRPRLDDNGTSYVVHNQVDGNRNPRNRKSSATSKPAGATNSLHSEFTSGGASTSNIDVAHADTDMDIDQSSKSSSADDTTMGPLFTTVVTGGILVQNSREAVKAAQITVDQEKKRSQRRMSKSYTIAQETISADLDAANMDLRNKHDLLSKQESEYHQASAQLSGRLRESLWRTIESGVSAMMREKDEEISKLKHDNSAQASQIRDLRSTTEDLKARMDQLALNQSKAETNVNEKFDSMRIAHVEDQVKGLKEFSVPRDHLRQEIRRLESDFTERLIAKGGQISKQSQSLSVLEQRFEELNKSHQEGDDQNQSRLDMLRDKIEENKGHAEETVQSVATRVQAVEQAMTTKVTSDEVRSQIQQLQPKSNASPEVQRLPEGQNPRHRRERVALPSETGLPHGPLRPQQHPQWQQWHASRGPAASEIPQPQRSIHAHQPSTTPSPIEHAQLNPPRPGTQPPMHPAPFPTHPSQRSNSESSALGAGNSNVPDHMRPHQHPSHMQNFGTQHPSGPPGPTLQQMHAQRTMMLHRQSSANQLQQQQQQSPNVQFAPVSQEEFAQYRTDVRTLSAQVRLQGTEQRQQGARLSNVELAVESTNNRLEEASGRLTSRTEGLYRRMNNQSEGIDGLAKELTNTQKWLNYRDPNEN